MHELLRTAILLAGLTALFMAVGYFIGGGTGAVIALLFAATTGPSLNFTVCPKGSEIAPVASARTKLADSAQW